MYKPLASVCVRCFALSVALLGAAAPAWALSCEDLRAEVASRIRSKGVSSFSIDIVDASSRSGGRVVGSCERGAKKLVYSVGASASASGSASGSAPAPADSKAGKATKAPPVLTECADGRVITEGSCKK
jgi:hypothetical protein